MTRKRRGEVVDKLAATYILQGALDFLAGGGTTALPPIRGLAGGGDGPGGWRHPDDVDDTDEPGGTGGA
jgi:putative Holliday junction resolvase